MCGIVGLLAYGKLTKREETIRQDIMRFLTTELIMRTEERGKDATGIATLFEDGEFICQKMGIPASEFVFRHGGKETDYNGYMKLWEDYEKPAKVIMAHCRKSSVGNTTDNENNHPVRVGNICLVHNGTLTNHDKIFTNLGGKRDGIVDTEAIVRLMHYYTENGKLPWTTEMLKEIDAKLEGSYSIMAFNANNTFQVAAIREVRPLDVTWVGPLKLAIITSDDRFVKYSLMRYRMQKGVYGKTKWPDVSNSDVILRAVTNGHAFVFNLLREVDEVKSITDLGDDINIPYNNLDDGWAVKESTYATNYTHSRSNKSSTTSSTTTKTDDKKIVGLKDRTKKEKTVGKIYNKELEKYVDVSKEDIDKGKKDGNVVIDLNDNNSRTIYTHTENEIGLEKSNADDTSPAAESEIVDLDNGKNSNILVKTENNKTIQVDMSVDVAAMEAASEDIRDVPKFSTEQDVCNHLNIANTDTLNKLPVISIANIMQRVAWKNGFASGWRKNIGKGAVIKKKDQSTSNIRTLKAFIGITTKMLLKHITPSRSDFNKEVDMSVTVVMSENENDLSTDKVNNVFSNGDKRNNPIINAISKTIEGKDGR